MEFYPGFEQQQKRKRKAAKKVWNREEVIDLLRATLQIKEEEELQNWIDTNL